MFLLLSEECTFTNGDVANNRPNGEVMIGKTKNETDCARYVKVKQRTASGALWIPHNNKCFAEFGNWIKPSRATSTDENSITRA